MMGVKELTYRINIKIDTPTVYRWNRKLLWS